jgi:hypothetical protein
MTRILFGECFLWGLVGLTISIILCLMVDTVRKIAGGQSKVHAHAANCSKTITHIQMWNFSLNIGYSVVGFLSKIFVPYCGISGFIDMAWGVCCCVFVDAANRVVMSKMISSESLNSSVLLHI